MQKVYNFIDNFSQTNQREQLKTKQERKCRSHSEFILDPNFNKSVSGSQTFYNYDPKQQCLPGLNAGYQYLSNKSQAKFSNDAQKAKIQKLFYGDSNSDIKQIKNENQQYKQLMNLSKLLYQEKQLKEMQTKRKSSVKSFRSMKTNNSCKLKKQNLTQFKIPYKNSTYQEDFKNVYNLKQKCQLKQIEKQENEVEKSRIKTVNDMKIEDDNSKENKVIIEKQIELNDSIANNINQNYQNEEAINNQELADNTKFQTFVDDLMEKNPDYFKHLTGQCICYASDFKQRCMNKGDQNFFKMCPWVQSNYTQEYQPMKNREQDMANQNDFHMNCQKVVQGSQKQ